jgi:hypothetical protein
LEFHCPLRDVSAHGWLRAANALREEKEITIMKKHVLTIAALVASAIGIAEARELTMWVSGSGTAQESDRASAVSEARETATEQANAVCIGEVVNVEATGTSCLGGDGDSPYTCMVFVKAECRIHTAH